MNAPAQYLEELRGAMSLYPTWFPGDPIELGTFGTIRDGRFVADGRLLDLGIEVVPTNPEQKQPVKCQSGMKLQAMSSASAKTGLNDAKPGATLEATREYAWAFVARGMSKTEIHNIHEVRCAVLEAQKAGEWHKKWLLVSEVRHVEHLNVLVARSIKAKGRIRGDGTVADWLDILLQGEASFELSTDDFFTVPNAKHVTPLYGLRKLRSFFDPQLRPINGGGPRAPDPDSSADEDLELELSNDEPFLRLLGLRLDTSAG
jgi:hypothetical protein